MSSSRSDFSALEQSRHSITDYRRVIRDVRHCPPIKSLRTINDALSKLTARAQSPATEIADVIRRDLSLTARLLRMVNSVFGGLSVKITSIEEAIFFLGLRQIRQLAMTTKVIDEVEKILGGSEDVNWGDVWRHSIGTGIMAREILAMTGGIVEDDTYYICGLLHDIGKLVMINVFPEQFQACRSFDEKSLRTHAEREKKEFGWNHCEIGAIYLEVNGVTPDIVEAVMYHHQPDLSPSQQSYAAGIQVADVIARFGGCHSGLDGFKEIEFGAWEQLQGWKLLFGKDEMNSRYARASVLNNIERLPSLLQGLL